MSCVSHRSRAQGGRRPLAQRLSGGRWRARRRSSEAASPWRTPTSSSIELSGSSFMVIATYNDAGGQTEQPVTRLGVFVLPRRSVQLLAPVAAASGLRVPSRQLRRFPAQILQGDNVVDGEREGEAEAAADADRREVGYLEVRVIEEAQVGIAGPDRRELDVARLQLHELVDGGLIVPAGGELREITDVHAAREGRRRTAVGDAAQRDARVDDPPV